MIDDFFEVANDIPKESKKIACAEDGYYQLYDPECVDDRNLVVDAGVIYEVVVGFNDLLFAITADHLLQFLIKDSFDVLFEFRGTKKIVSLRNTDNFDCIEESTKVSDARKYLCKRYDSNCIIHESAFEVIHGYFVEVADRLPRPFIVVF